MSKFNHYARKLNEIVKTAFAKYQSAEQDYLKAERSYKELRPDADTIAKAKAMIVREDAQHALKAAKSELEDTKQEIRELRRGLDKAVSESFSADPAMIDGNTVELLKSGILTASEYCRLLEKAKASDNPTMCRLIGKFAGDTARALKGTGRADENTALLLSVERNANFCSGNDYLTAFDAVTNIYSKCVRTPAMISQWDSLVASTIESF